MDGDAALYIDIPCAFEAAGRASDLDSAKKAFLASGLDLVACFNDPMPGNFLVKEDGDGRRR